MSTVPAPPVVSWDVMTYRGVVHPHSRRSAAYRLGYALGTAITRPVVWLLNTTILRGEHQ
jgi:hypothetical protein